MPPKANPPANVMAKVDLKSEPDAKLPLTNVDIAFYELEIQAIKAKIDRLVNDNENLESQNEFLEESNAKIEANRGENIARLKKTLEEKIAEKTELFKRLELAKERQKNEDLNYEQELFEANKNFDKVRNELQTEVKTVQGSLNALEEFRNQKEDLLRNYEELTMELKEKEQQHANDVSAIEKKFIAGKDQLKKEMSERLVQLSMEFQDVTDARVAVTTHRAIRENIIINSELNTMASMSEVLEGENNILNKRFDAFKAKRTGYDNIRGETVVKSKLQFDLIKEMERNYGTLKSVLDKHTAKSKSITAKKKELDFVRKILSKKSWDAHLLEQNYQNVKSDLSVKKTECANKRLQTAELLQIIMEILYRIQEDWVKPFESFKNGDLKDFIPLEQRQRSLLKTIQAILMKTRQSDLALDSEASHSSCENIIDKGEPEYPSALVELRSEFPVRYHKSTQVNFEDFIVGQIVFQDIKATVEESEEEVEEESEVHAEESKVFFSASTSEISSEAIGSTKNFMVYDYDAYASVEDSTEDTLYETENAVVEEQHSIASSVSSTGT